MSVSHRLAGARERAACRCKHPHAHTHAIAHCTLDMREKDPIRAAILCLEQTQIRSWNSGRKTDMCELRDAYGADYSRSVGVWPAARHKQLFQERQISERGEACLLAANVSLTRCRWRARLEDTATRKNIIRAQVAQWYVPHA